MSKPSVLHVYKDYYPPVLGGMEKCIHWMCDQTRDRFHVRVLVASRSTRFIDEEIDGVRVVRVPCYMRALSAPLSPGYVPWLRRLDSDILHFHMPNPTAELAWMLSKPARGRLIATYHSDIVRQKISGALYGPLQQKFLSHARVIMTTSETYLQTSRALQPHLDRCRALPLGIPLGELDPNEASRIYEEQIREMADGRVAVMFIGLLRYYKGLPFLLEAMRQVGDAACLFIAGPVPDGREHERTALEKMARELGIADRVFFLGALSDDEAVGLRHGIDIFCLPSHQRSEAFGLSQIESMACGTPVVSTDLPGVAEVNLHGKTGLVVPPGDDEALANALRDLVQHPNKRAALGEAARERAFTVYSAERMGNDLEKVYREVLEMPEG